MHRRDILAAAAMSGLTVPVQAFEREGASRGPMLPQPVATQPAVLAGIVERQWPSRGLRGTAASPVRGGGASDLRRLHVLLS